MFSETPSDLAAGQWGTSEASSKAEPAVGGLDGHGYGRREDNVAGDRQGVPRRVPHPVLCVRTPVLADTADEVVLGFGESQNSPFWTPLKTRIDAFLMMEHQAWTGLRAPSAIYLNRYLRESHRSPVLEVQQPTNKESLQLPT